MSRTRQTGRPAAAVALSAAVALAIAGCTSDEANPVGAGVPDTLQLQVNDPETIVVAQATARGHVTLEDEDVPYDQNQVLYFGGADDDSSSILVRYDVSTLPDSLPEWSALSTETITRCQIKLYRLDFYAADLPEPPEEEEKQEIYTKHYQVHRLSDPLDATLYPGPEPAYDDLLADQDISGAEPAIDLSVETVLDWVENGMNGAIIREGDDSRPGLIGYASADIHGGGFGQMQQLGAGTTVGATLRIRAYDELWGVGSEGQDSLLAQLDTNYVFAPVADVSTFHDLSSPADDPGAAMILQTHLRSSPYFSFDLASLPDDVFINRAVVRLGLDFEQSFGPNQALVLHAVPRDLVEGAASLTLEELREAGEVIAGQFNVDREAIEEAEQDWVGFDVTAAIQRIRNGVLDADVVFVLTAGESFTGYLAATIGPDFYLSRYVFHGFGHAALFPHLEITYTPFSGGER
jgi:hypothetical protein